MKQAMSSDEQSPAADGWGWKTYRKEDARVVRSRSLHRPPPTPEEAQTADEAMAACKAMLAETEAQQPVREEEEPCEHAWRRSTLFFGTDECAWCGAMRQRT